MNILFIGFKNSGKSFLGKKIAEYLNLSFFDTDVLIEKKLQMTCFSIYNKWGEEVFRKIEKEILTELLYVKNSIISTGGGIILSKENQKILHRLGKKIYLDTKKEVLIERWQNGDKTFITTQRQWEELFEKRKKIYEQIADDIIEADSDLIKAYEKILKKIQKYAF